MNEFLHWLQTRMPMPTWFGWFHIMWIIFTIAACTLIFIFRKRISKKGINITLLCLGIVCIVLEIYKQVVYAFHYNDGGNTCTWDYEWYSFPFQFCSTPMYLMVLAAILRKGKVYDSLLAYLATYALFAGLVVMIYTGDVFSKIIGINIQTMVVHCGMFVVGFMLLVTRSVKISYMTVLKATTVFVSMLLIALLMNITWHYCSNIDEEFNMFFISPYYPCSLAVLNVIYNACPYPVFLIIYILGFMLAAAVMMTIAIICDHVAKDIRRRKMLPDELQAEKILSIIKKDL